MTHRQMRPPHRGSGTSAAQTTDLHAQLGNLRIQDVHHRFTADHGIDGQHHRHAGECGKRCR
jgi:hypothetical protein